MCGGSSDAGFILVIRLSPLKFPSSIDFEKIDFSTVLSGLDDDDDVGVGLSARIRRELVVPVDGVDD